MRPAFVKTALWTVAGLALAAQFVRPERSNPPVTREVRWDSEATRYLAQGACYDCHSNETDWPWYSLVTPVSWLVVRDVVEGREHLNFSAWDRPNHGLDEIIGMIENGEMPPREYALMHPKARLDAATRAILLRGLKATLAADRPVPAEGESDEEHPNQ
ncbi:MAG: heme-binding domain-containing protein [Gemmatimonadetes bacterium]|nr:heme-binding domain-containing protein [Gemmatimonadota bacterium]